MAEGNTVSPHRYEVPLGVEKLGQLYPIAVDSIKAAFRASSVAAFGPVMVRIDDGARLLPPEVGRQLSYSESFWVTRAGDTVLVVGSDGRGAIYGLIALAEHVASGGTLEHDILESPAYRIRAAHFVLRRVTFSQARRVVDAARRNRFNTLVVQLTDGVAFENWGGAPQPNAWSVDEFRSFVRYVRESGLELVPELKLLTHQEKLFRGQYPHLLYNDYTYDPRLDETYERVFAIIDEIIELTEAESFHIGHDEVHGVAPSTRPQADEPVLPADLFLRDVLRLHEYLSAQGVETWMWGDMLIARSEFPEMLARDLNANEAYAALRTKIPQDVVIVDWHYSDRHTGFPTADAFLRAGHDLIGATWKNHESTWAFADYLTGRGPQVRGMIATTWFHVQNGDWETVEGILRVSGEAFWSAHDRVGSR